MLTFRKELKPTDPAAVREMTASTGFFDQAPDEIDVAVELVEEALKDGCEKSGYHFLFAEEDGEPLAYVCFGPIPCTLHSFDFYWLATHKKAQRRGIGRQIVFKMFDEIKKMGGKKVFLQTSGREQYKPTHLFYNACGFDLESRLKDYYGDGDDCLTFSYTFS